tara:strand:- start:283 stop:1260 length:978 start_codon:yes stop_codon:yes gene_type:complete
LNTINKIYFSHGRVAFKYGLLDLDLDKNSEVLIPSYICDSVIQPLRQLKIRYKFYELDSYFRINFTQLGKLISKNTKAILKVNYFGQPDQIELFIEFCKKNSIFLIEDNSHGYGGTYKGKNLGTYGDSGFSSPRKILDKLYGGVLYTTKKNNNYEKYKLSQHQNKYFKELIINFLEKNKKYKNLIYKILNRNIDYNDIYNYKEKEVIDYLLNKSLERKYDLHDWSNEKIRRISLWKKIKIFANKHHLDNVIDEPHSESCPWMAPFICKNLNERNEFLIWANNKNINAFPWPSLPLEIINKQGPEIDRWNRLICFSLNNINHNFFI